MSEHNDAVLLYHNPDTTILELLVDSQRRTDVAVQQKVMSLMEENPGVTMRLVTRSELLRYSEMARQQSEKGEKDFALRTSKRGQQPSGRCSQLFYGRERYRRV